MRIERQKERKSQWMRMEHQRVKHPDWARLRMRAQKFETPPSIDLILLQRAWCSSHLNLCQRQDTPWSRPLEPWTALAWRYYHRKLEIIEHDGRRYLQTTRHGDLSCSRLVRFPFVVKTQYKKRVQGQACLRFYSFSSYLAGHLRRTQKGLRIEHPVVAAVDNSG